MSRGKVSRAEIVQRATKIREFGAAKGLGAIEEEEIKKNPLFLSLASAAPQKITDRLEYFLSHIETESEMEVAAAMVEKYSYKDEESTKKAVEMLVHEIAGRKGGALDMGCVGALFLCVKRILVQRWEVLSTRGIVRSYLERETKDEKKYFMCVVLAEVLKIVQASEEEVEKAIEEWAADGVSRSYIASGLLLDRNNRVQFGVENYVRAIRRMEDMEIEKALEEVAGRTAKEEMQRIADLMIGGEQKDARVDRCVMKDEDLRMCNLTSRYFTEEVAMRYLEVLTDERVTQLLEKFAAEDRVAPVRIVDGIEAGKILRVIKEFRERGCEEEGGEQTAALMENRLEREAALLREIDPCLFALLVLSSERLKERAHELIGDEIENRSRELVRIIISQDEEKPYEKMAAEDGRGSVEDEMEEMEVVNALRRRRYGKTRTREAEKRLVDPAFAEVIKIWWGCVRKRRAERTGDMKTVPMMRKDGREEGDGDGYGDGYGDGDGGERRNKMAALLEVLTNNVLREEIAESDVFPLVIKMIVEITGEIEEEIEREKGGKMESGDVEEFLETLVRHSEGLSRFSQKEHVLEIEKTLSKLKTEKDGYLAERYFAAIMKKIPFDAQKKILRNPEFLYVVWSRIEKAYRRYEETFLANMTGSDSMSQFLQHGVERYTTEDVLEVEGNMLLFVSLFFLDTKYPLEYLKIFDKTEVLHSGRHKAFGRARRNGSENAEGGEERCEYYSRWDVVVSEETGGSSDAEMQLFYCGEKQSIALDSASRSVLAQKIAGELQKNGKTGGSAEKLGPGTYSLGVDAVLEAVRWKAREMVKRDALKDVAVHALTGRFIFPREEGVFGIQQLIRSDPAAGEIFLRYMWGRSEYRAFGAVVPDLEETFPTRPEKKQLSAPPGPGKRAKIEAAPIQDVEEKDTARKAGFMLAQLAASKKSLKCNMEETIRERLENLAEDEKKKAAAFCFEEISRFWRTDREKVTKHLDSVALTAAVFIREGKTTFEVLKIKEIVLECFKSQEQNAAEKYGQIEDRVYESEEFLVKNLIYQTILHAKSPKDAAQRVSQIVGEDVRFLDPTSEVVFGRRKEGSSDGSENIENIENNTVAEQEGMKVSEYWRCGISRAALETLSESNVLLLSVIKHGKEIEEGEIYRLVLERALNMLGSRNEEAMAQSLWALSEEYMKGRGEFAEKILSHSIRYLLMRTKVDKAGEIALGIVQHAIFMRGATLSEYEKNELICTLKYDLYHYQHLLLHFIQDLPVGELLEIIGKMNTAEARSGRPNVRKAVVQYVPKEKEGIRVFAKLMAQSRVGSAADRVFVLELVKEMVEELAQGSWGTVFVKACEALANESSEKIQEHILAVIRKIAEKTSNKKQIKEIYGAWKKKESLAELVEALAPVFEH